MNSYNPFDWLASLIVTQVLSLSLNSRLGSSLYSFLCDVPKMLTVLLAVSFVAGTFQSLWPPEKVQDWLGGRRTIISNVLAAMAGIVTPFCSCSVVPLFMGFLEAGVPLGVTLSYLIAAPMVNEVAVALLWGLFGLKVALLYTCSGLALAIAVGYLISLLKLERWVEPFVWKLQQAHLGHEPEEISPTRTKITWKQRLQHGWYSASQLFKSVWLYVVVGIAIGAVIQGYAPEALIIRWAGSDNPLAVPIAVGVGIPLYANIAGVLLITKALVNKGVPLGTVLAFTMAATALSLPEIVMLRKVLQPPLLTVLIALVTTGFISVGYLLNTLLH